MSVTIYARFVPEIAHTGSCATEVCAAVSDKVLLVQFQSLKSHGVHLEGAVLKPNLVRKLIQGPNEKRVP